MYHSNCTYYSTYYRYGYQGQFAEKDPEIGLNSFEARMYDSRIGRWLTTDPAGQHWSSYMEMGNVPSSNVDANGKTDFRTPDGIIHTIDDNVQISYAIEQFEYEQLQLAYDYDKTLGLYWDLFNRIDIGSLGYYVALTARGYEGSDRWALDKTKDGFDKEQWKCNLFVYDILRENNAIGVYPKGSPPQAGSYANPNIDIKKAALNVVSDYKLGDIIAGAANFSDATGHVEIISKMYWDGEFETTGAIQYSVYTSSKGYDMYSGKTFLGSSCPYIYTPVTIRRP